MKNGRKRGKERKAMSDQEHSSEPETPEPRFKVRLPGFVKDEQIGLGDVITRFTHATGLQPCAGCAGRAQTLNQWVAFTR
jgi:hypothetical protein